MKQDEEVLGISAADTKVRRRLAPAALLFPGQQHRDALPKTATPSPRSSKRMVSYTSSLWCKIFCCMLALSVLSILMFIGQTLGIRINVPRKQNSRRPPLQGIPLTTDRTISVVLMNHDRPYVLQRSSLLPTLWQHPSVSEILLLHSNPETSFSSSDTYSSNPQKKMIDVDAAAMNKRMGLALRFHYCAHHVQDDWVLILDDDMELDATAIDALIFHMQQNPQRIIGHYGRSLQRPNVLRKYLSWQRQAIYDTKTVYGNVEVVLTKILLLERNVCAEFEKYMHLMEDIVATSKPYWNGEDIFVNLVANRYYGVPLDGPYRNFAVEDLPVWEANVTAPKQQNGVKSISGNLDNSRVWNVGFSQWHAAYTRSQKHNQYRGDFWHIAKDRLWRNSAGNTG